jgi:hypothetical protein
MNNATTEERMALAMSELSKETKPNIMGASKKYQVNRTTLSRRFKGIQQSQAQFLSESRQCLTNIEERVVLDWINDWTERFIPPTSCMVHSIAQEVSGVTINKNWVSMFAARHRAELHSDFLNVIDAARAQAENIPIMGKFYDQVSIFKVFTTVLLLM